MRLYKAGQSISPTTALYLIETTPAPNTFLNGNASGRSWYVTGGRLRLGIFSTVAPTSGDAVPPRVFSRMSLLPSESPRFKTACSVLCYRLPAQVDPYFFEAPV